MVKVLLGVLMFLNGLGGALAALRGGASFVLDPQRRRGDGDFLFRRTGPCSLQGETQGLRHYPLQPTTTAVRPFSSVFEPPLNPPPPRAKDSRACPHLAVIATTSIDEQAKSQDLSLKEVCYMALYKEEGEYSHFGCTDVERPAVPQFSR